MNSYETKVKEYLESNNVNAEHFVFKQSCHSVQEAAEAVNGSADDFVKNICMINSNNELIVAIVKGNNRASTTRVAKSLNIERPRLANGNEIIVRTGFPPGGVPSFGFQATFLVDPKVTNIEYVYTGGGSENSLVKINVKDLLELNKGTIVKISK